MLERYCVLKTYLHKKLVESISELAQNWFVFDSLFYSIKYNTWVSFNNLINVHPIIRCDSTIAIPFM
jgi:hypothetical protein